MKRWLPFLAVIWASSAIAHHSFANIYDSTRSVTLDGVVSEFQFIHPHPFLVIKVSDAETWRAEMDNRFELADIGMTAQTFKAGDHVLVTGSPGRTEARVLYMWKLERASDGLRYEQVGSTPRIDWPERASAPPDNSLPTQTV